MSVYWTTNHFGYDGDFIRGDIKVDYWQAKDQMLAEIDRQTAEIREHAEAEWSRLSGVGDD
jgi:hypothetical protein